jgi:hypothetical protein
LTGTAPSSVIPAKEFVKEFYCRHPGGKPGSIAPRHQPFRTGKALPLLEQARTATRLRPRLTREVLHRHHPNHHDQIGELDARDSQDPWVLPIRYRFMDRRNVGLAAALNRVAGIAAVVARPRTATPRGATATPPRSEFNAYKEQGPRTCQRERRKESPAHVTEKSAATATKWTGAASGTSHRPRPDNRVRVRLPRCSCHRED